MTWAFFSLSRWRDDCMDVGGRATKDAKAERAGERVVFNGLGRRPRLWPSPVRGCWYGLFVIFNQPSPHPSPFERARGVGYAGVVFSVFPGSTGTKTNRNSQEAESFCLTRALTWAMSARPSMGPLSRPTTLPMSLMEAAPVSAMALVTASSISAAVRG